MSNANRYYLGTVNAGRVFVYTALGSFRTPRAAITAYNATPRTRTPGDLIIGSHDVARYGVVYGSRVSYHSISDGSLLPDPTY